MIKATKIRMQRGFENSNSVLEIDEIYLEGLSKDGFYSKEDIHDFIKNYSSKIQVNIYPYPSLIAVTKNQQKYVRSEANDSPHDNLLRLPRV